VPGVTAELAIIGGVAIFGNELKSGPSPTRMFGLGGQIAAVEVRLRDQRETAMTIMTAIDGCLTLQAILFDATESGLTAQDASSFASALAVEWYQPNFDRRWARHSTPVVIMRPGLSRPQASLDCGSNNAEREAGLGAKRNGDRGRRGARSRQPRAGAGLSGAARAHRRPLCGGRRHRHHGAVLFEAA